METNIQKPMSQQTLQQTVLAKQKTDSKTQQASEPIRTLPSRQASNHEACDCQRGRRQGRSLKINSQKCWVYDNSQKKVVKRLGVLTMPALKYCILRGSFSGMFDSLAIITSFGGLRTRARTDGRTHARTE